MGLCILHGLAHYPRFGIHIVIDILATLDFLHPKLFKCYLQIQGKGKINPELNWSSTISRRSRETGGIAPLFLVLALDILEWSASLLIRVTSIQRASYTHFMGDRVDPKAGLVGWKYTQISYPSWESNSDSLVIEPVACSLYRQNYPVPLPCLAAYKQISL
jgi:hypothetical protein